MTFMEAKQAMDNKMADSYLTRFLVVLAVFAVLALGAWVLAQVL